MALGLDSIYEVISNGVTAINKLTLTIKTVFPQLTGSSTSAPATAGTITFTSSQAVMFELVTTSSGYTGKVPIYPQ